MSFSKYFDTLDPPTKKRYCEKLKLIDDIKPYAIKYKNFTYKIDCLPTITYPDIKSITWFLVQVLSRQKT